MMLANTGSGSLCCRYLQADVSREDSFVLLYQEVSKLSVCIYICLLVDVNNVCFSYLCRLNSCKTRQELEDYWGEMIGKDIKPDDVIKQTYKRKIEQFENVNKS